MISNRIVKETDEGPLEPGVRWFYLPRRQWICQDMPIALPASEDLNSGVEPDRAHLLPRVKRARDWAGRLGN